MPVSGSFEIKLDVQAPSVIDVLPQPGLEMNAAANLSINLTAFDEVGVDTVVMQVSYPNGTSINLTMENYPYRTDANTTALYHFENSSGAVIDSSGNGNDGTNNGSTYDADGPAD